MNEQTVTVSQTPVATAKESTSEKKPLTFRVQTVTKTGLNRGITGGKYQCC